MSEGSIEKGKGTMGNPVAQPGGRSLTEARVSPPLTAGHQSPSSGDHGAQVDPMAVPGPRELAWRHPHLRQSSTSFDAVLANLRTVTGDNANGDRDVTYRPGEVALRMFDARGQAGSYPGMQPVNPSPQRPDGHQSRGSAAAPVAAKGSDALRIMKETQNRGRR